MTRLPHEILAGARVVAVVGMSTSPAKEAHTAPLTLVREGWTVIPVHPSATEIAGCQAYRRLADIPQPVDLVDVFRPAAECADVARQAVAIGAKAIWLQLGITSAEARRVAEDAGVEYVEDRCVAIEARTINGPDNPS